MREQKGKAMTINIGVQDFCRLREEGAFYVDKTDFIREWWESLDQVTLITRPRRFGKTLNMSMLECFFSNRYAGRGELFEGLSIWKEEAYRKLQGTYPVIFLSFASIKTGDAGEIRTGIKQMLTNVYGSFRFIMESGMFDQKDREYYASVRDDMSDGTAYVAINRLCMYLEKYFGKKVILLLDEYDTPMQEAWTGGSFAETVSFFRSFFNASFKTNTHMFRAVITGITRISKESVFSDLNNPKVITTTSERYAACFGFTEDEVFDALKDAGLGGEREGVKSWYDGFTFGSRSDIYNPWSITNFIDEGGKYKAYWADTSGNGLVSSLIQQGSAGIKRTMEQLMNGECMETGIDEEIVYSQLEKNENALWSLLLALGYLRVVKVEQEGKFLKKRYTLKLTNREVVFLFANMIADWFGSVATTYNDFVSALLAGDVDAMNGFMNRIALQSFSCFDVAKGASGQDEPERFYHGFVLGLMVGLEGRFTITSNRESGFGRYDIVLEPADRGKDQAYIIEFKVRRPDREKTLADTVDCALRQIEDKRYEASLVAKGIDPRRIRKYGFAFEGKSCLIG